MWRSSSASERHSPSVPVGIRTARYKSRKPRFMQGLRGAQLDFSDRENAEDYRLRLGLWSSSRTSWV